MASTPASFARQLQDFWKDDFGPLQSAGQSLLRQLREEEAAPNADLYRELTHSGPGSHMYFDASAAATAAVVQTMRHVKSVPLPPELATELSKTKAHSLMGLFGEARLAWMTVDSFVYLWSFDTAASNSFCSYQTDSAQSIVAVGLVKPKKGVFRSMVEWVLVLTTPDEVLLCALARTEETVRSLAHGDSSLSLVQTNFRLATEARILSVTGTANGRIFLGGEDGCLYEFLYGSEQDNRRSQPVTAQEQLEDFYDKGRNVPAVITTNEQNRVTSTLSSFRKRTLDSLTGSSSSSPSRKCRKVNRSAHASSLASALFPDMLVSAASHLLGQATAGGGPIVQMIVDEERQALYTLSSKGWISVFDLKGKAARLAAVMNAPKTTRLYLEATSRGQMLPPTSRGGHVGNIAFPGGGAAAQAGVGGMEGARAILRGADWQSRQVVTSKSMTPRSVLKPVSIHVVPRKSSSRLTLVAVTQAGLRLYLSSLAPNVITSGISRTSGTSSTSNPLAPASRLTLCHVRGPPPTQMAASLQDLTTTTTTSVDAGIVVGGMAPRMASSMDSVAKVDASFYADKVLVTGMSNSSSNKNPTTSATPGGSRIGPAVTTTVGDVVVAACPDAVARKKEKPQDAKDESRTILSAPGGITETVSLPVSTASIMTDNSNTTSSPAILPGGILWDIASISDEPSTALSLTFRSQTPTDSELSIGLPPAYFPPSKVRATHMVTASSGRRNGTSTESHDAIVARDTSLSSTAAKVLINVMANFFLSRPIRQGITFQDTGMGGDLSGGAVVRQPSYRISKRDGSKGFSSTAAEPSSRARSSYVSPSKTTRAPISARLRPWLLRPAVVPLNQFSTQHLLPGMKLVALNTGGLHYFGIDTILTNLAEVLMSTGENVASDPAVRSFFTSYGYKEGCAMCLALAVGCGPARGNATYSQQVRRRASNAAFAYGHVPKLLARSEYNGSGNMSIGIVTQSDPLVPERYDFRPSMICEGLTALFSRLVRPIWYKPAVVVTEGRTVKLQWSTGTKQSPAKVEILLDDATLDEIRTPLRNLHTFIREEFKRAIENVPGVLQRDDNNMDIDYEGSQSQFITRALQYNSHLQAGTAGQTTQLAPMEAENIARLIEEKNIHSMYRLLSRAVQLLNLMSLLRRAQGMVELREIDWGLLHGLTFAQLVETSEGQDRLESLLNSLVTSSASESVALVEPSAQADDLANSFASQCYMFFSPGSRSAYLGLRAASDAFACPGVSSRRSSSAKKAADYLRSAATHWHSASLISGRIIHTKGQETYEQIALRAMQYNSPLAKAVDALVRLEDVASAVDICLITAANFKNIRLDGSLNRVTLRSPVSADTLPWEQHLYHKRRDPEQSTNGAASSSTSPSHHLVPYGTAVTSKDAIDTCYALIFYHLSVLLRSRPDLADKMVSACVYTTDKAFLSAFFQYLLESNHADTLLRIDSPQLEDWLRDKNEPNLLWRHYNILGKYMQAGQVAWGRALDPTLKLPLSERLQWLSRALNSFSTALSDGQEGFYSAEQNELAQKKEEVKDSVNLAQIQNQILHEVDAMKPSLPEEMTEEKYQKLSMSLVPVSELYNDYAAALSMYHHCLRILHFCRRDDGDAIRSLWKAIFSEELLPCATRSPEVYRFLLNFVADVGLGDEITLLTEGAAAGSLPLFESGDWAKTLETRVVGLGRELYGTGADYVCPVDFLLSNLEDLRRACDGLTSPGWSLLVLAEAGVPFLVILDAFESLSREDQLVIGEVNSLQRMEHFAGIIDLLNHWVSTVKAMTGEQSTLAQEELSRARASGRLLPMIDHLKGRLEAIPAAIDLLERVQQVEVVINYLV